MEIDLRTCVPGQILLTREGEEGTYTARKGSQGYPYAVVFSDGRCELYTASGEYCKSYCHTLDIIAILPMNETKATAAPGEDAKALDPWQHRAERMRCKTCMWFIAKAGNVGRCRRHAPTMSGYPVVFTTDWCGDHKLDEAVMQ